MTDDNIDESRVENLILALQDEEQDIRFDAISKIVYFGLQDILFYRKPYKRWQYGWFYLGPVIFY